jgi:hypothetical protein
MQIVIDPFASDIKMPVTCFDETDLHLSSQNVKLEKRLDPIPLEVSDECRQGRNQQYRQLIDPRH